MPKHPPFLITKEKNIHLFTKRDERTKRINNSLNNLNIIKINSFNNLDSNGKNKNIESKREETNIYSSTESGMKFNEGRWTKEEHKKFLKGMMIYGNNWKMVHTIIKTRSSSQARSHAQKYFMRMKKKIKSKYKKFNAENLIKYVFNEIKKVNGGQPINANDKKRALNVIISNFQNFRKEEIESCNMIVNEIKVINSQENGCNSTFYVKECNNNIVSEKYDIIIEINHLKSNFNIEDKPNEQKNKMEFCTKKRKDSSIVNKIFQINKVVKYKYFNKINENSNRQNFVNLKIKKTKNKTKSKNKFDHNIICPTISESYNINNNINNIRNNLNNLLCNISVNNDMNSININFSNKDNMNSFTNNNFNTNINNNINDSTYMDINKINFSEPLFDFGSSIRKINYFDKFVDEVDFNDSLKSIFLEDNNISLGEQDNYFPITN